MLNDLNHPLGFEIRSCSRVCTATSRPIAPGETYFSVLEASADDFLRRDYCVAAWQGPPEDCVAWWRSRVPGKDDNQPRLAPTDVMLNLFEALEDRPQDTEFRYLLGLLLLRRKILRHDDKHKDHFAREVLILHCQKRQKDYELIVAIPSPEQATKIQNQMFDLLYGNADTPVTTSAQPSEQAA